MAKYPSKLFMLGPVYCNEIKEGKSPTIGTCIELSQLQTGDEVAIYKLVEVKRVTRVVAQVEPVDWQEGAVPDPFAPLNSQ